MCNCKIEWNLNRNKQTHKRTQANVWNENNWNFKCYAYVRNNLRANTEFFCSIFLSMKYVLFTFCGCVYITLFFSLVCTIFFFFSLNKLQQLLLCCTVWCIDSLFWKLFSFASFLHLMCVLFVVSCMGRAEEIECAHRVYASERIWLQISVSMNGENVYLTIRNVVLLYQMNLFISGSIHCFIAYFEIFFLTGNKKMEFSYQ